MDRSIAAFKICEKGAQFRSKLLTPLDISRLGLLLFTVRYVTDIKHVKSIGFVFPLPSLEVAVGSSGRALELEFLLPAPAPLGS
jgi:hypothetical protein